MTVRDLMEMVCDHCFGDLKWCQSHTKEEFYAKYIPKLLRGNTFTMSDDSISISWDYETFQEKGYVNEQDLAREVKDGYWVYTVFVSTDDIRFDRYDDKVEAFKQYLIENRSAKADGVIWRLYFNGSVDALFIDTYRKRCVPYASNRCI